jgi:aminocarboxymuconate-semialdehyde decarboxylase
VIASRIDVHNHALPEEALEILRADHSYGVGFEDGRWHGPDGFVFDLTKGFTDIETKIGDLKSCGIDTAVLSPAPPLFLYDSDPAAAESLCEAVNEGLSRMAGHGDDMRWMGNLPMRDPERAAAMVERLASTPGCVGVEVGSAIGPMRLDEPRFESFWATAERTGLPVMIHPEIGPQRHEALDDFYLQNVIGFPLETTLAIERLIVTGLLQRHPGLRILLVHGGGYFPYQAGRLRHARTVRPELAEAPTDPWDALPQLWFDVLTHDAGALAYLVSRVGVENVVLGTDLPFDMSLPDPMAVLDAALDADSIARITDANAVELFSLDD